MTYRDLLAIIHRDGGHHTEEVGENQSIVDASKEIYEDRQRLYEMKELLRSLSFAGVELEDPRMSYVVVQIDAQDWEKLKEFRSSQKEKS